MADKRCRKYEMKGFALTEESRGFIAVLFGRDVVPLNSAVREANRQD